MITIYHILAGCRVFASDFVLPLGLSDGLQKAGFVPDTMEHGFKGQGIPGFEYTLAGESPIDARLQISFETTRAS